MVRPSLRNCKSKLLPLAPVPEIDQWILDPKGTELASYNPATGELIGKVIQVTASTYEQVVTSAQSAFLKWRCCTSPQARRTGSRSGGRPANVQGTPGRPGYVGDGARSREDRGEVQEMIDISDFGVGPFPPAIRLFSDAFRTL